MVQRVEEEFHQIIEEIEQEKNQGIKLTYFALGFFLGSIVDVICFIFC